jgi:hypothetical protein
VLTAHPTEYGDYVLFGLSPSLLDEYATSSYGLIFEDGKLCPPTLIFSKQQLNEYGDHALFNPLGSQGPEGPPSCPFDEYGTASNNLLFEDGRFSLALNLILADAGIGMETTCSLQNDFTISDAGSGTDIVYYLECDLTAADAGYGSESVSVLTSAVLFYDSGSGTELVSSLQCNLTASDNGSGTDQAALTNQMSIVTDQGTGSDSVVSISFTVTDFGVGAESWGLQCNFTVTDNGSGTDAITALSASFTIQDAGSGIEIFSLTASFTVSDSGVGTDLWAYTVWLYDQGLSIDIAYLTEGIVSLDGVSLPHVQSIGVDEPSILQDLPVMDALPYRRQIGKKGRSLKIQGWTDSLATLEALREYPDGQKHLLLLPTGDSMYVLISGVQTPEDVANYTRYDYTITAVEAID